MGLKEIKEALENKKIIFGIRELLKNKKKVKKVYVAKDCRNETKNKLFESEIDFEELNKTKKEIAQELKIDFLSEVYSII